MLPRTLETEVMDTESEAVDYDAMDHGAVNRAFVGDFLTAWESTHHTMPGAAIRILDVGTGTAQIPLELCRRTKELQVLAVDLASEMLKVAARNVADAGFSPRICLQRIDAKNMPFDAQSFGAVISNSIVHHIPEPGAVLQEMVRVLRPGGLLFVRDLLRPRDAATVEHLVCTYAADANAHQQQMFRESLHAALTVDEVRHLLDASGIQPACVSQTSDRHWTLVWENRGEGPATGW